MIRKTLAALAFCSSLELTVTPGAADVKMPAIFGDHMILQQDQVVPVWGWAAPGEKITVLFAGQRKETTADSKGDWQVKLDPLPEARGQLASHILTISGTNTLIFQDVLIGDVWVASGQSNMEFGVGNLEHSTEVVARANEPSIRIFCVPHVTSLVPLTDLPPASAKAPYEAKWQICTPEALLESGGWGGFSAVAFLFSEKIQHAVGHPIGIIRSSWGGTPAQAWTSLEALQKDPALAHYADEYTKHVARFSERKASLPQEWAAYHEEKKIWDEQVGADFDTKLKAWNKLLGEKKQAPPPPKPTPLRPAPQAPIPADGGPKAPTNLYNSMIAPLMPFAIKGVIWYQGESNTGTVQSSEEYAILFPSMITDWRRRWNQGDFPFLYVQLASYGTLAKEPSEGDWPWLREGQTKTLALPKTGMAIAIDIGDPSDVHPKDKENVASRLARAALRVAYGQDIVDSGPLYESMLIDGNTIKVSFKNANSGLKIGASSWAPYREVPQISNELTGFAVAGDDKKWFWAKALITKDGVLVSSDKVPKPVAIRYGWANFPLVNLYNQEGLPASPFRTDNWIDHRSSPK